MSMPSFPKRRHQSRSRGDTEDLPYPYVQAWGRMLGSSQLYVADQITRARAEHAPSDAVYRDHDTGRWITTDEIWPAQTRDRLGLPPLPAVAPDLDDITAVIADGAAHNLRLHDIYGLSRIDTDPPFTRSAPAELHPWARRDAEHDDPEQLNRTRSPL
jgi:hypothetical protein